MASAKLNRRRLIRYETANDRSMALPPMLHIPATAKDNAQRGIYWYHKALRILQTVLREHDAPNCDATAVVAYMRTTECNTLIGNGGGIVDFFQNPLPAVNINSFMGKYDIVKEITGAFQAVQIRPADGTTSNV